MATAQTIVDEVRRIIHDENPTYRWSDNEMLGYVNAAIRQTVTLVPESYTLDAVTTITNNIARQSIPAGGIKFIRVGRNYADDGTTPQGPVRYVEKDALDSFDADWEYNTAIKADGANFFEHYCHDKREPKVFYLYPPQAAASKKVSIVYSAIPTALTSMDEEFPQDEEYVNATVMYVIYRALTKESRDTLPDAYRQELWSNYLTALGLQREASDAVSPGNNRPPEGEWPKMQFVC
jgi:hypothetical protein